MAKTVGRATSVVLGLALVAVVLVTMVFSAGTHAAALGLFIVGLVLILWPACR